MSLRKILAEVSLRAVSIEVERQVIDSDLGIEPEAGIGPEKGFDLAITPHPEEIAFRDYLETLSHEDLLKLEALMYLGRGSFDHLNMPRITSSSGEGRVKLLHK